jgi:hypothetical protein
MEFIDLRCRWTERTRSRGAGWFYYKGVGLQNGLSVELDELARKPGRPSTASRSISRAGVHAPTGGLPFRIGTRPWGRSEADLLTEANYSDIISRMDPGSLADRACA